MDMEPKVVAPEPVPPDPESTAIRIRHRSTLGDLIRAGMFAVRRSDVVFGLGLAMLIAALGSGLVASMTNGSGRVVSVAWAVAMLIGSLSLLTGAIAAPYVWWESRRRPEPVGTEYENVIDEHGFTETSEKTHVTLDWSVFRGLHETRDTFYFGLGAGYGFLPKRSFSEPELATFRRLIAERGLVRRPRRLRRVLIGIAVPLSLVAITVAPVAVNRLAANPRLELSPTVDGRTVSVHATTDIPDGALISVGIMQLEEYAQSIASGGPATVDSPWVRITYKEVRGGAVDATFDARDWPAGRARAIAYFNIWLQPDDVVERYGSRGEQMSGPNVRDVPEAGRELRVSTDFMLP